MTVGDESFVRSGAHPRVGRKGTLYMKLLSHLLICLLLATNACYAAPAAPGIFEVSQPDGTKFKVRNIGDEWCHWIKTVDGYGAIQDRESGWWYYAIPDDKEDAKVSEYPVGTIDPESLQIPKALHKKCGGGRHHLPPPSPLPTDDERQ